MTTFANWLDTFVEEKGLDRLHAFEVEGRSGLNIIPLDVLLDHMKIAPKREQDRIKDTIVRIDFLNGNVMDFFKHLAGAIAV
jgi:hypothetical protein